jgi:hypothetical protein
MAAGWDLQIGRSARHPGRFRARGSGGPRVQTIKVSEDDRRRIERQRLADDPPANDGVAKRLADLRAGARAEC